MADLLFYEVFGLRVASELRLPELMQVHAGDKVDVRIETASLEDLEGKPGLTILKEGALLDICGVGRFLAVGGSKLLVDPFSGGSERNVRLYLLGSALAAILHQRELLPLHANAVVVDGRAVAFMGHPGAGKSTLAAWFHDRGREVLADDVCVVTGRGADAPLAHAGIPRLRLWREALEASGRTAEDYELSFDGLDKFTVPTEPAHPPAPAPLSHIYILDKSEACEPGRIERLQGSAAVDALVSNTYRGAYLPLMGGTRRHLLACAALAGQVPVFRARRRWGYGDFETENRALEKHAAAIIGGEGKA